MKPRPFFRIEWEKGVEVWLHVTSAHFEYRHVEFALLRRHSPSNPITPKSTIIVKFTKMTLPDITKRC